MKPQYKKNKWSIMRLRPAKMTDESCFNSLVGTIPVIVEQISFSYNPPEYCQHCMGNWYSEGLEIATKKEWDDAVAKFYHTFKHLHKIR